MKVLRIILAVGMLLCLAPMPYGYYILLRYVAFVIFALTAYENYKEQKMPFVILYSALALLFQPFLKIALGRGLWNVIDIICAIILIAPLLTNKKTK